MQSVRQMCRAAADRGIEVEVVTTTVRGAPRHERIEPGTRSVDGIPVHYFDAHGPRRYFFSPGLLEFLYRNVKRYDAVHIQGMLTFPPLAASRVCARARVPYLLAPRGSLDPWALGQKALKKTLYLRLLEDRTILRAARLHFTADAERLGIPPRYRNVQTCVVPNCVDIAKPTVGPKAAARGNEVLFLGRIHKMKGFDVLMPAIAQASKRVKDLSLTIAGPDEDGYAAEVHMSARRLGIEQMVRFVGLVGEKERSTLLERAALLVLPSYRENFGMVVAEAMSAGVPVIVSNNVNIAQEIAEAGAGRVVPMDSRALADAMVQLLAAPEERDVMGQQGAKLVRERFSPGAVGKALEEVYRQVVEEAGNY
ncbi:MAG: glycosyltransferase [Myxococcales bacterium]